MDSLEKLEIQINYMAEKKCALCCATYLICNSNYETIGINIPPRRITYKMIKRDNKIGCLTAIYDTKALGKKYYMPTIRKKTGLGYVYLRSFNNAKYATLIP